MSKEDEFEEKETLTLSDEDCCSGKVRIVNLESGETVLEFDSPPVHEEEEGQNEDNISNHAASETVEKSVNSDKEIDTLEIFNGKELFEHPHLKRKPISDRDRQLLKKAVKGFIRDGKIIFTLEDGSTKPMRILHEYEMPFFGEGDTYVTFSISYGEKRKLYFNLENVELSEDESYDKPKEKEM